MTARVTALKIIAERDGLTVDSARVLIEMWAWPIGLALKPAYDKAVENHPDWQQWLRECREGRPIPSLTEWLDGIQAGVESERRAHD